MNDNMKIIIAVVVVVILGVVGFTYLTTPEERSLGQKIEDAGNSLDEGVDDAARQLEDRTPAEKIEDEYDDATDGDSE